MTEAAQAAGVEWRAFMQKPALYAAAGRLTPCFGGSIGEKGCARMLAAGRLEGRLSRLLLEHYQLSDAAPDTGPRMDETDRTIALANADRLGEIALYAGAVYWAAPLAGAIRRETTAALHAQLGTALCEFAIVNRDLAGPEQPIEPVEGLRERVEADGWRCLAAWCCAVAQEVGTRVRLKLAPLPQLDDPVPAPFAETGPAIVRRVAVAER
jgi:hypothetical protein